MSNLILGLVVGLIKISQKGYPDTRTEENKFKSEVDQFPQGRTLKRAKKKGRLLSVMPLYVGGIVYIVYCIVKREK